MVKINNIQEAIYYTVDRIVQERIAKAKYDKTYRGVVVNATPSVCTVRIDGDTFTCNILEGEEYTTGDVVYVLSPQQSPSDKVILGKVKRG